MLNEFGTSDPSSRPSRYEPGWVTSTIRYEPSHNGDNFCRFTWYCLIVCWCLADKITAASLSSWILSRSVTRDSSEFCSLYNWTWRDLYSISVGNMASDPYTRVKGNYPVALLGVVRSPQSTAPSSFIHFPADGLNRSKIRGLSLCKIIPLARSTYPLLRGCATDV